MEARPPERTIAGNALFAFLVRLATSAFTAVSTLFLARYLGPATYGIFALALGVSLLVLRPADLGITAAASRFVAERHGDLPAVARVMADSLRLKLLASGVVALALALLAAPIAHLYGKPALVWPLRGVALAMLGQSVLMLPLAIFGALRRTQLQLGVVIAESAVELGATIGLVLLGAGAAGAAFGRAAGYVLGSVAGIVVLVRLLGRSTVALRRRHGHDRQIVQYAGAVFLVDSAMTLYDQIDVILIGAYLSAGSVAFFQAPLRLVSFLHYPGLSISAGVSPRLAKGRTAADIAALANALRLLVLMQIPVAVGAAVWAEPIARLTLGGEYGPSTSVIRALAPYLFLAGLAPLVSTSVSFAGAASRRVVVAAASLALNAVLDIVLIPRIGVVAGAVGSTAAYLLYVPWHLALCRDIFGLRLRPLVESTFRALVAGAAMAGVLALFGTARLSAIDWIAGGLAALLAYVAVLYAVREISREDLVRLRALLPRSSKQE